MIIIQMMSGEAGNIPGLDSILRGEIMRKDALVTQLLNQNKEVSQVIQTFVENTNQNLKYFSSGLYKLRS